jgi:hypothetical protein
MKTKAFLLTITAAFALLVPLALGAEQTREAYVATVEPICKSNTQANEKILKGVKTEVKKGKLKPAGTQFAKAASALKRTYAELKAVPQPSSDAAKLTKWLSYVKEEASLFEKTAKALKSGNKNKAQTIVVQLTHNANLANDQVLSFNFRYCRFEPSKFT